MNKYMRKGICLLLSSAFLISASVGCTKKDEKPSGESSTKETPAVSDKNIYPMKTDVKIKFWSALNPNLTGTVSNLGETPLGKELEKKTGIKVEYIHPSEEQARDQFNIMISSGDIPDIIEYNWSAEYPGGPEKAISDGVIIPLNEAFDKYSPNIKKLLAADGELNKQIKSDSGNYYVYPMVRAGDISRVFRGPIIRKDWLDDVGMQVPTTIDEWYDVLKAFKDKKGATAPFIIQYNQNAGASSLVNNSGMTLYDTFIGAYKTSDGFYIGEDGKVKYGPIEQQYKEFLATFRKWYSEGLIDKDFPLANSKAVDANILGDKSGATVGLVTGTIGKYLDSMKGKNAKFDLVGAPYPTLKKGETPFSGQCDDKYNPKVSSAITKTSKNVEIAARWLDYAFSEEGSLTYNYGVLGESYVMENGNPKVTDLILKNPEGKNSAAMQPQYMKLNGAYPVDQRFTEQMLFYPQMKQAAATWSKTEAKKHNIPQCLTPTPEESKEIASIINKTNTYFAQMFVKFVMGTEPLENFDKYVDEMKKSGIEKAIKIRQDSLDRYNKR